MTTHILVVEPALRRKGTQILPPIVIYTKSTCSYCRAAKDLLRRKGAPFEEIRVDGDRAGQAAMAVKAGGRSTVPQIFIGATMSAAATISMVSRTPASSTPCWRHSDDQIRSGL